MFQYLINFSFPENSSRSTDSVPNLLNGRLSLTNGTNVPNPSVVANTKTATTYSRRREQQDGGVQLKHRAEISDDSQSPKESMAGSNTTSGTNGKPARKLSVYIPKVRI